MIKNSYKSNEIRLVCFSDVKEQRTLNQGPTEKDLLLYTHFQYM